MIEKEVTIINRLGLHARAAAKFVQTASRFEAEITISNKGKSVNGKSIMGVMMLAAGKGSSLLINCDGEDENEAITALEELIQDYFGEGE